MSDDEGGKGDDGGYEEKVRGVVHCKRQPFCRRRLTVAAVFLLLHSIHHQIKYVSVIAKPLASKKTTKRIHKLVRKASQAKIVRRGVKEVVKALRKGEKGFCVIAGDISPVDVITHLPIMCEDRNIPYFYVPSKHDLGAAATTKRPTSCVLINPKDSFAEKALFDKIVKEANQNAVASS